MEFNPGLVAAMLAAFVGAFVRGFTGFGGALIFIPVASAVVGPQLAAPIFLVIVLRPGYETPGCSHSGGQ